MHIICSGVKRKLSVSIIFTNHNFPMIGIAFLGIYFSNIKVYRTDLETVVPWYEVEN